MENSKEIKRYLRLKAKAQEKNDLKEESEYCNILGDEFLRAGNFDQALTMHNSELDLCKAMQDVTGQAIANRKIGDVYVVMGRFDEAVKHHTKHLQLSSDNNVELQRANTSLGRTYLEYSRILTDQQKSRQALLKSVHLLDESLKITRTLKEDGKISQKETNEMKIRSWINLGICYHELSNISKSKERLSANVKSKDSFEKAVHLARRYNFDENLYLANYNLTTVHLDQNRYSSAIRNAETALRLAKRIDKKDHVYESLDQCAKVHLMMENTQAAKTCLKQLYKSNVKGREDIEPKLRTVIRMCHLESELTLNKDDVNSSYALHEAIADLYCNLQCYHPAIKHYKLQERLLDELDSVSTQQKRSVFFSIASTLVDVGELDEAIEYYRKEIKCTADRSEQAKTLSYIANCMEKKGSAYSEIASLYEKAVKCAEETSDDMLTLRMLVLLEETQRTFKERADAGKTRRKITELELKLGVCVDELDKEDAQEANVDDCPLDGTDDLFNAEMNLSDDADNDEEGLSHRRRKKNFSKKNEKGETLLHRACIEGQVKSVEVLIKQGHPVNPRDFCGWIPLHEACNHGHEDIVNFLLNNGAHINDTGGQLCDNITPINDAATNGHFETVETLLSHGADPNIASKQGKSTLDSLVHYYQKHKEDLDSSSKQEYKALYAKLKSMTGHPSMSDLRISEDRTLSSSYLSQEASVDCTSGSRALVDDDLPALVREPRKTRPSNTSTGTPISRKRQSSDSFLTVEEDLPDVYVESTPALPLASIFSKNKPAKARKPNRQFISSFSASNLEPSRRPPSKTGKINFPKRTTSHKTSTRSALTEEEQHIVEDDWLVPDEDLYVQPIKRHRRSVEVASSKNFAPEFHNQFGAAEFTTSPSANPSLQVTQPPAQATTHSVLRLKVKVEDKAFIVAVPGRDKTIGWLIDKTASRYEEVTRLRPVLSLSTNDGCLLSHEDIASDVLSNNDVVIGKVESWNLVPFSQRYVETCRKEKMPIIPRIKRACVDCESSKSLRLQNLGFTFERHLKPLIVNIGQQELHKLLLPGNRLDEDGIDSLCESLMRPSPGIKSPLVELDLACCGLEDDAVVTLSQCTTLHKLTHLNISFNSLSDGRSLEKLLINLKCLKSLILRRCWLSDNIFNEAEFPPGFSSHLEHLDVSKNDLGRRGTKKWLSVLDRATLRHIDLREVADEASNSGLISCLVDFVSKAQTSLDVVDVSRNFLTQEQFDLIGSVNHLIGVLRR